MKALLGIDVGTSATKSVLCDFKGKILAVASSDYPVSTPRPGWSEQDPELWWAASRKTVRSLLKQAQVDGRDVAGVGLSGQMHGAVFMDKSDRVLRPAILWNDQRTTAECEEMTRAIGPKRIIRLLCNPALVSFTASKVLWLRRHEPKTWAKVASLLLPKDYVRFRLTGTKATEVSDASGMLLLDVRQRRWSQPVLDALAIDRSILPEVFESPVVSATVSKEAARATGLVEGTPVVGGGGDQAAGALGNGIVKPGVVSATIGTSGVVFAFTDQPVVKAQAGVQTFCHAVPGKWHVMGVVLSAGGSLQWFRNNLADGEVREAAKRKCDPYDLLTRQAASVPAGAEGLIWLPYLTGERTPHRDPFARAAWVGLTPRHTRAHMVRALMEGATFAMRDCIEVMREMGVGIDEIRISGGGARSAFWRRLQADVYGHEVLTVNAAEGPAYGVALLAGVAAGAWDNIESACSQCIRITSRTPPSPDRPRYNDVYPIYRHLYRSLKNDFAALDELEKK